MNGFCGQSAGGSETADQSVRRLMKYVKLPSPAVLRGGTLGRSLRCPAVLRGALISTEMRSSRRQST